MAPKKPPTAYLLFFHCMKGEVNETLHWSDLILNNQVMVSKPEMSYKEVMMEMGRVWNEELDEEQKAPFLAQHQQLMVEWKKAMDAHKRGEVKKGPAKVVEGNVLEKRNMDIKQDPKEFEGGHGGESIEEYGKRDEEMMEIIGRREGASE